MASLRYWWLMTRAALRAETQYRANFAVAVLGGLCYQGVGLAAIGVVLSKFGSIGGWSLTEVAFLYALRLTAHGLWVVPFSQLLSIDQIVREGHFDRFLIRPGNPLVHLMTYRVAMMPLGDLIGGIGLLTIVSFAAPIDWSPLTVGFLVLAVVGGALTELSVQLAVSALTFRTLASQALRVTLDTVFNTFGGYPITIFSGGARFALTFLLPLAFVAYLPSAVLFNRSAELHVPGWLAIGSPLVGILLFTGAYMFWNGQLHRYQSSGH